MIIELNLTFKEHIFLSAWELDNEVWKEKSIRIHNFIEYIAQSYRITLDSRNNNSLENIQYIVKGKPFNFFDMETRMQEYLNLFNAQKIIS